MIKAIQKRIKNNKGFTLVELIVVLAILGIIAAIAVPRFMGVQDGAEQKADQTTAKSIEKATELAHVNGIVDIPAAGSVTTVNIQSDLVNNGYLDQVPSPQVDGKSSFKVTVDENGKITVTYNDDSTI